MLEQALTSGLPAASYLAGVVVSSASALPLVRVAGAGGPRAAGESSATAERLPAGWLSA